MKARTRDGAEISYAVYDFSPPWTPTDTILLHHGLRSNRHEWRRWVPRLADEYRVVVVDARGRGESTIPEPGFPWSMEQFATDDLAVLDDLGVEQAHYLGASFGGVLGLYLGATYPQRFKTLSLVSTPYRFTQLKDVMLGWVTAIEEQGMRGFLETDIRNMLGHDRDKAMLDWYIEAMTQTPERVAVELIRFCADVNLVELLPKIAVPTVMLAAAKSDRAPAGESELMARTIPGVKVVTFDAPHHISAIIPEQCAEAVKAFLREHR